LNWQLQLIVLHKSKILNTCIGLTLWQTINKGIIHHFISSEWFIMFAFSTLIFIWLIIYKNRVYQCRYILYSRDLDLLPLMLTLEERVSITRYHYRCFFFSHSVKGVLCRKGFQWENFYCFKSLFLQVCFSFSCATEDEWSVDVFLS
jgi:hypothetical protein